MTEEIDSCLKFSKNSWHYKTVKYVYGRWYFDRNYRVSLCKYFWTVVTSSVIFPFIFTWRHLPESWQEHSTIAAIISIWALVCTGLHIGVWLVTSDMWFGMMIFFAGLGAGTGVCLLVLGLSRLWDFVADRRRNRPYKPSLVKEFLKAKKKNVCPCIEFVDPPKPEEKIRQGLEGL